MDGVWFGDQLAVFRPNFVQNCEFRFFVQNAKFRDFVRFLSKTNFLCPYWWLTQFPRHTLHWRDVANQIQFRLCVQVYKCQHSMTSGYLAELCRPVSNIDGHQHLRSAGAGQLDVPRVRLSTYGGRVFCYVGPSAWNALPDFLKNKTLSLYTFRCQFKHFYFSLY